MWEEVIKIAVSNGIFAVLFCSLLIYDLKVSGKREAKYQKVIQSLSQSLTALKTVEAELDDCEKLLEEINGDLKKIAGKKKKYENVKNENSVKPQKTDGVLYA